MRWLWRIAVLVLLFILVKGIVAPKKQAFIAWPEQSLWLQKVQWNLEHWQEGLQDLPASIEVEIRRLWQDFRPGGDSREV